VTEAEREFAIRQLTEGRDAFLSAFAGLSAAQLHFKADSDNWSIAECIEHITVTEEALLKLVTNGKANPEGVPLDPAKDGRMAAAVVNRNRKVSAPASVRPTGRFQSLDEAGAKFCGSRERAISFARDCTDDLRSLFTPHPVLGDIDCYRCLLLLALHPARHAAQIEEIKRNPAFPR